jgi:hypothetical protein
MGQGILSKGLVSCLIFRRSIVQKNVLLATKYATLLWSMKFTSSSLDAFHSGDCRAARASAVSNRSSAMPS